MDDLVASVATLRVLLVEDDLEVAASVLDGLTAARMEVVHAATIRAGKACLAEFSAFDVIVLDLNLPDGDGREVVEFCRKEGLDIPILMTTARDTVNDRIAGLSGGADDYLCKPFAVAELLARIAAVCRRARPRLRHTLRYEDVELDLLRRRVRRGEIDAALSAREVDFLAYLISHPEEILSKERLLKDVWGDQGEQDDNVLHVYANYLRNKLEGGRYPRILHTVRAIGYVLAKAEPGRVGRTTP